MNRGKGYKNGAPSALALGHQTGGLFIIFLMLPLPRRKPAPFPLDLGSPCMP